MNVEASKVISNIIEERMGLDSDQVWVSEQNINIPEDERLYVVIGMVTSNVTSNNNKTVLATVKIDSVPEVGTDMSGMAYFNKNGTTLQYGKLTTIDLETNFSGIMVWNLTASALKAHAESIISFAVLRLPL